MAIGPVRLIVLRFHHPDFHGEVISPLDLVAIGMMSAKKAKELHALEISDAACGGDRQ